MTLRSRLPLAAVTTLFGAFGLQGVAHAQAFYLEAQSARGAGRAFPARPPIPGRIRCGGTRHRSPGRPM